MNQPFQYSILKYRPSYLLDERVNIGLLFHFVNVINRGDEILDESKFVFVSPSKLARISKFFPDLGKDNLKEIKRYLSGFKRKAKELSWEEHSIGKNLNKIISTEFIINDANSLFFSEIKEGVYESSESTVNYFEEQYFKYYDRSKSKKSQDALVKEIFRKSLIDLTSPNDLRLKYFEEGVNIDNKITTSKFEYRWQNGKSNLVKTLGFDLSDKQDIQDKAFKWSSAINYINKIDKYSNYHFDILVTRPSKKPLFKAYDKALDVLSDINGNKEIIEAGKIKEYAEKALNTVKPFEE